MRYLKLFEAFQSEVLSKTIKFLSDKLDKNSSENFIDSLRKVMDIYQIPIDKLADSDLQYLSGTKALKLKKDSVNNIWGISYLKFWFSIEEGYLGWTGTTTSPIEVSKYRNATDKKFSSEELAYIIDKLGINTGILWPVTDYRNLTTGDKVIGLFDDDRDSLSRISFATIWKESDGRLFAIQDVSPGGDPRSRRQILNGQEIDWKDFGSCSWSLGDSNYPADDHKCLSYYKNSTEELRYFDESKEKPSDFNSHEWNIPCNDQGKISSWRNTSNIDSTESLDKSDFCIVIDLDKVLEHLSKSIKVTKKEREQSKEGATKFLSDKEISKMNLNRYFTTILSKMNIKVSAKEVKDLQKIMSRITRGKYSLITIYNNRPSYEYIARFSINIKNLLSCSKDDADYYLNNIISDFNAIQKEKNRVIENFTKTEKDIKENNILLSEVFEKIYEIGDIIDRYFNKVEINTYQDLKIYLHIFKSIRDILEDGDLKLNTLTRHCMSAFESDVKYYIKRHDYTEIDKNTDLKKLEIIKKYVQKALG